MPDIATLDLQVKQTGVQEATRSLGELSDKASGLDRATAHLTTTERALVQQWMQKNSSAQRQVQEMERARQATEQLNRATQQQATMASGWAAAQQNMTAASRAQVQQLQQLRAMYAGAGTSLAGLATNTARNAAVTATATINYNKLREAMTAMAFSAIGTAAPGVATLTSTLGAMALGAAPMVAILAGVAALGFAWKKLTQDARELKEASKQARDEIDRMQMGEVGGLAFSRGTLSMQVAENQRKLDEIRSRHVRRPEREAELEREIAEDIRRIQHYTDRINEIHAEARRKQKEEQDSKNRELQQGLAKERAEWETHYQQMRALHLYNARADLMARRAGAVRLNLDTRLPGGGMSASNPLDLMGPSVGPSRMPRYVEPIGTRAQEIWRQRQAGGGDGFASQTALMAWGQMQPMLGNSAGANVFGAMLSGGLAGGPAGMAAGAFVALTGAILNSGKAAEESAKQHQALRRSLELTLAGMRAELSGNPIAAQLAQIQAETDQLLGRAREAFPKPGKMPRGPLLSIGLGDDDIDEARLAAMHKAAQVEAEVLNLMTQRITKLLEEARIRDQMAQEDFEVRRLAATGRTQEASDMAFRLGQEREYQEAVKAGLSEAALAALRLAQAAEAAKRAADSAAAAAEMAAAKAEESARFMEDLNVRQMRARGMGSEADMAAMTASQRREIEEAIKAGRTPEQIAELNWTHTLEMNALALEQQIAQINKNLNQQLSGMEASNAGQQDMIQLAEAGIRLQEQQIEATRRVVDSLREFADSLVLNPSMTILSPAEQLIEARRQFDIQVAAARGGDADAAMKIPDAARTFLEASRGFNASGPGYVADFLRTQAVIAEITEQFGEQLTVEERMLAELQKVSAASQAQVGVSTSARDAAIAAAAAEIAELIKANEQLAKLGPPIVQTPPPPPRPPIPLPPVGPPGGGSLGGIGTLPPSGAQVQQLIDEIQTLVAVTTTGQQVVADTVAQAVFDTGAQTVRTLKQIVP